MKKTQWALMRENTALDGEFTACLELLWLVPSYEPLTEEQRVAVYGGDSLAGAGRAQPYLRAIGLDSDGGVCVLDSRIERGHFIELVDQPPEGRDLGSRARRPARPSTTVSASPSGTMLWALGSAAISGTPYPQYHGPIGSDGSSS